MPRGESGELAPLPSTYGIYDIASSVDGLDMAGLTTSGTTHGIGLDKGRVQW